MSAHKAIQGSETKTRDLLGGTLKEKRVSLAFFLSLALLIFNCLCPPWSGVCHATENKNKNFVAPQTCVRFIGLSRKYVNVINMSKGWQRASTWREVQVVVVGILKLDLLLLVEDYDPDGVLVKRDFWKGKVKTTYSTGLNSCEKSWVDNAASLNFSPWEARELLKNFLRFPWYFCHLLNLYI